MIPRRLHHHHLSLLLPPLFLLPLFAATSPLPLLSSPNPDLGPLLAFKLSLSRPTPPALSSWDPAADHCSSWRGVSCRGGRVARLVLVGLRLDGPIHHLAGLPRLALLSLNNNSFSSPLHRLDLSLSPWRAHLKHLHLSHNRFSGPFPASFLRLRRLRRLDLAGNLFSGTIPPEIGLLLRRLLTLRLEENELGGAIPVSVGSIPGLTDLNVSYNRLVGEIPRQISSFPPSSFAANPGLCGGSLPRRCLKIWTASCDRRPPPMVNGRNIRKWVAAIAGAISATIAAAAAVAMVALLCLKRRAKNREVEVAEQGRKEGEEAEEGGRMELFEGCGRFALEDLMRGSAEMLGRGAVGSTYRVVIEGGEAAEEEVEAEAVVVKRVRRRVEEKSRKEEEEELLREVGGWRHPNVVSLRAYHYSSAGEELLLVYDYLPNGSLSSLLHGPLNLNHHHLNYLATLSILYCAAGNRGPGRIPLEWTSRLQLALGAAKGLAYLHGTSNSTLSHQHLTSSNVLVDGEGNACISDFALLELVSPSPPSSSFSSGSHAAVAETRQRSDVYSFGIILLEILTGRPEVVHGEEDLAKWVQTVVREEWTSEVFDIELTTRGKGAEDEMFALLQVALLCVAQEPKDRPRMAVVYKMIEDIRERGNRRSRGSLSPSLHDHSYESSSPGLSDDTPTFTS
ncbi:hypothetical protein BHE74_00056320, partial [Ensete ventricosum]